MLFFRSPSIAPAAMVIVDPHTLEEVGQVDPILPSFLKATPDSENGTDGTQSKASPAGDHAQNAKINNAAEDIKMSEIDLRYPGCLFAEQGGTGEKKPVRNTTGTRKAPESVSSLVSYCLLLLFTTTNSLKNIAHCPCALTLIIGWRWRHRIQRS